MKTNDLDAAAGGVHQADGVVKNDEIEINLTAVFAKLWRHRFVLIGVWVLSFCVMLGAYGYFYLLQGPVERSSLSFRLIFDGVKDGKYPNGMRFSPNDILSPTVLEKVFDENSLRNYVDFASFQNAIYIEQTNTDLQFLEQDYMARLSNNELTAVERQNIEEEFKKKKDSLLAPIYNLIYVNGGQVKSHNTHNHIPAYLVPKVLNDILAVWVDDVTKNRDVFKYRIALYGADFIAKDAQQSDSPVRVLLSLRKNLQCLASQIKQMRDFPGARLVRGENNLSLNEVSETLEELENTRINPLLYCVVGAQSASESLQSHSYMESLLRSLQFKRNELQEKIAVLTDALAAYQSSIASDKRAHGTVQESSTPRQGTGRVFSPSVIPQFGESLLSQLVAMSGYKENMLFRQDLTKQIIDNGFKLAGLDQEIAVYTSILDSKKTNVQSANPDGNRAISKAEFAKQIKTIKAKMVACVKEMHSIHDKLSNRNLQPATYVYSVLSSCQSDKMYPLTRSKFIKISIFGLILVTLCTMTTISLKKDSLPN